MPQILTKLCRGILSVCFCIALAQTTHAQNVEVGAMIGAANYIGDLAPTPVIQETKGAGGIFARINMSSTWAWNNAFNYAQVSGNDKNFAFNSARNLNFRSNIYEFASTFEFNYLKYGVGVLDNKLTSYVFLGVAVFGFEPQANLNGQWINLRPIQTEGHKYQPYAFGIPFGIGMKWRINRNLNFECQFGFRKTYTDYLDDVSTTYPDINAQLAKGQVAALLTDPSALNEGHFTNKKGYKRGNADFNDWYIITGVSLSYRLYSRIKCARFY